MNITTALVEYLNLFGLSILVSICVWAMFNYLRYYIAGLKVAKKENKILFVINVGSGSFGALLIMANMVGGTNDFTVPSLFSIIWFFTTMPLFFTGKP